MMLRKVRRQAVPGKKKVRCPACNGAKRVPVETAVSRKMGVPSVKSKLCGFCNGDGKVWA